MSREDDIRARWAAVSPPPWKLDDTGCAVLNAEGSSVATHSIDGWWAGSGPQLTPADAAAIAQAPTDIAWLLAELERLKAGTRTPPPTPGDHDPSE